MVISTRQNSVNQNTPPVIDEAPTQNLTNLVQDMVNIAVNAAVERIRQELVVQRPESREDVKGWLFKCEQFFKVDNIAEESKANLVSIHLFDLALMWHRQFVKFMGDDVAWDDYIDAFDRWLCRNNLDDDQCISFLLAGLSNEIELAVCPIPWLGIQWLANLGNILTNFKELRMEFKYKGKRLLRGSPKGELQWVQGTKLHIQTPSVELSSMVLCVYPTTTLHMIEATESQQVPNQITELLQQYVDVFTIPTTLPPTRPFDHINPLKEGTFPINSRPYRHLTTQKDAIEVVVKELLDTGVIRDSQSPFSSPVVMVKKKDGTWRMGIDYRRLNNATIKDKFPIPVIEELIDELQGYQYFTKLDLRSGYHQIRMHPDVVEKTAFKTHEGHYEFLVMPFGHTNAPSTFQALMNSVFKAFLRRFVLVFFDDTLVYSPDLETHVWHLDLVLQVLRQHTLYAKQLCLGLRRLSTWEICEGALISYPLTQLLKKNGFKWSETAQAAFDQLKQPMTEAPLLKLPDFNKLFILETDASIGGIGAVLQQGGTSSSKITTPSQMKWLPKLMRFDYEILYKQGSENKAADALSRIPTSAQLRKGKLVVGNNEELRQQLLQYFHADLSGGHSGVQATLKRIIGLCYWKKLRQQVKVFVAIYRLCQTNKPDLSAYPGLLQPLPISTLVWSEISMDFIEGLPSSNGKSLSHPFTAAQIA
ncbi:transposon ty3-I gag-pol polyprotein [Tanacetum coccineum]